MAGKSAIEWTEQTWNPVVGCSIVSPGCTNCYAMQMATRIQKMNRTGGSGSNYVNHYDGTTKVVNGHAVWTGKLAKAPKKIFEQPLSRKKPTMYFVNSMSDLFHEDVPDGQIDQVFAIMALSPQHTFQVLTKRAARMREYFCRDARWRNRQIVIARNGMAGVSVDFGPMPSILPLPNVWLGVSTERQQEADERIPLLLQTPAAVRFISAEPLLGSIDLTRLCILPQKPGSVRAGIHINALKGNYCESGVSYKGHWDVTGPAPPDSERRKLDWVIVGGESGSGARPMHPAWPRDLRDQCAGAGIPMFFKQWGAFRPLTEVEKVTACGATLVYREAEVQHGPQKAVYMLQVAKKAAGRLLDGELHDAMPERSA